MKLTNAELMKRKREGKKLLGLKELRGVYVNGLFYEEIKSDFKAVLRGESKIVPTKKGK